MKTKAPQLLLVPHSAATSHVNLESVASLDRLQRTGRAASGTDHAQHRKAHRFRQSCDATLARYFEQERPQSRVGRMHIWSLLHAAELGKELAQVWILMSGHPQYVTRRSLRAAADEHMDLGTSCSHSIIRYYTFLICFPHSKQ